METFVSLVPSLFLANQEGAEIKFYLFGSDLKVVVKQCRAQIITKKTTPKCPNYHQKYETQILIK